MCSNGWKSNSQSTDVFPLMLTNPHLIKNINWEADKSKHFFLLPWYNSYWCFCTEPIWNIPMSSVESSRHNCKSVRNIWLTYDVDEMEQQQHGYVIWAFKFACVQRDSEWEQINGIELDHFWFGRSQLKWLRGNHVITIVCEAFHWNKIYVDAPLFAIDRICTHRRVCLLVCLFEFGKCFLLRFPKAIIIVTVIVIVIVFVQHNLRRQLDYTFSTR